MAIGIALAGGCVNPNAIGVQQFGDIAAHVVMASNGQAVSNALVSPNATQYCYTDANGNCTISKVAIGSWTVTANAPGLEGRAEATVTENQTTAVTIQMRASNG